MSKFFNRAMRLLPKWLTKRRGMPPLPTFSSAMLVDVADRDALYRAMEEE
jgi:hypothetical protein